MPATLIAKLDAAARRLNRSRAEVLRQATEAYLDDHEDLRIALERLQGPNDPVLVWDEVRRELVAPGPSPRSLTLSPLPQSTTSATAIFARIDLVPSPISERT